MMAPEEGFSSQSCALAWSGHLIDIYCSWRSLGLQPRPCRGHLAQGGSPQLQWFGGLSASHESSCQALQGCRLQ